MTGPTATSGVRPRRLVDIGSLDQVVELSLTAGKPGTKIDAEALAETLGVDDPTRIVIQTERRQVLVRVYPRSPLLETVPATAEDLTMDARGRIRIGRYYDGEPVTWRLWDSVTGAAQRGVVFGTTGAGKSRIAHAILIGCKRSRVTVHLADLKSGQSVPEAAGQTATRVTSQAAAIHMLRGLVARAKEREERYGRIGRSGFIPGRPDPLEYAVIDEANRLLETGAPYRREAVQLVKELGRAGRSVGVGIILLAQASQLTDLGGNDTLRAMLKEGEVILLRWSSNIMANIVSAGLLPPGIRLTPVPKVIGRVRRIRRYGQPPDQADQADDVNSQGCGYHLTGPRPEAMMRALMIGSLAPHPGHDPAILALYGDGPPPGQPIPIPDTPVNPTPGDPDEDEDEDYDDEEGEDQEQPEEAPPPVPAGPRTIAQRITTALAAAGGTATTGDLLAALAADGGRTVARGSLDNALAALRRKGALTSTTGTHTLTRS